MKPPVRLVPDNIPHDVTAALDRLQHDAKVEKDLIGIAYVAFYRKNRGFIANAAGEYYRSPDAARGHLAQLHDLLGKLGRGEPMPPGW
jgi:hypothetical protein